MMNKYSARMRMAFAAISIVLLSSLFPVRSAAGPLQLEGEAETLALDSIVSGYSDWGRVSLSGKLRSSMLPVSVSVRIYMEKDRVLRMSLSAPIFGEVGRLEIQGDSVVVINTKKRRYACASMSDVAKVYPGGLADLQNLLLGRATIFGIGPLGKRSADDVTIVDDGSDMLAILPAEPAIDNLAYAYAFDRTICRLAQLVMYLGADDDLVEFDYTWRGNRLDALTLDGQARIKNRVYDMQLQLGSPEWGGKEIAPWQPDDRCSRTSLKEVLRF